MTVGRRMKSALAISAAGLLALTACSGGSGGASGGSSAEGESITINSMTMVLPNTPTAPAVEWFFNELEERSDGRITVDRTEPESICKAPEIAQCVIDGRADMGVSISDYSASLFPSVAVAGIPFMVDSPQALMSALYEVNQNNESAVAQWENNGIEFMGAWSPGTTIMGSKGAIDGVDDLKALKLRAIGSSLPSAFDMVGANVVSMPAAESYENIERGVADAVAWTIDGAVDYKLMEQLDTWTDPGVGAYTTFALWMNKSFYDGMPDDLRTIVDEVRDEFNAGKAMEEFNKVTEQQCSTLIDFPNTANLTAWSESATDEWKDLVQEQLITDYIAQSETDGLTDAQSYFDDYVAALDAAAASAEAQNPFAACIDRFDAK